MKFGSGAPQGAVEPQAIILDPVTAKNMFIRFSAIPTNTVTATLRKNGIDTTLVIATSAISATNTVDTVSFAVNDRISMKIDRGAATALDTVVGVTLE